MAEWLERYRLFYDERYERLDDYIREMQADKDAE